MENSGDLKFFMKLVEGDLLPPSPEGKGLEKALWGDEIPHYQKPVKDQAFSNIQPQSHLSTSPPLEEKPTNYSPRKKRFVQSSSVPSSSRPVLPIPPVTETEQTNSPRRKRWITMNPPKTPLGPFEETPLKKPSNQQGFEETPDTYNMSYQRLVERGGKLKPFKTPLPDGKRVTQRMLVQPLKRKLFGQETNQEKTNQEIGTQETDQEQEQLTQDTDFSPTSEETKNDEKETRSNYYFFDSQEEEGQEKEKELSSPTTQIQTELPTQTPVFDFTLTDEEDETEF